MDPLVAVKHAFQTQTFLSEISDSQGPAPFSTEYQYKIFSKVIGLNHLHLWSIYSIFTKIEHYIDQLKCQYTVFSA